MLKAWLPLIKELSLILLAVFLFQVLFDVFSKKMRLKDSLFTRFLYVISGPWGWAALVGVFIGIILLIYTVVFE